MTGNELISIKQLPIIEEQLKSVKTQVKGMVSRVLALECSTDTVKAIKAERANLNKTFKDLEERRKLVKNKILEPYEAFEAVYKECVSDIFKGADSELSRRINDVEGELKAEKRKEIEAYFNEYCDSLHIDFVDFSDTNISVTLSASKKSLKEQAKAFADKVRNDLDLIDTQEHADEILYYYKSKKSETFLNANTSIMLVVEKYEIIEAEKRRREAAQKAVEVETETIRKVDEQLTAPTVKNQKEEHIHKLCFTVYGTMSQLRALKEFLQKEGLKYE